MWLHIRTFVAGLPLGTIAAIVIGSTLVSIGALFAVVLLLPRDYFATTTRPRPQSPVLAALTLLGLNLFGLILVGLGIVLSIPGVPGQGVLTIIVGILLMDFPGKRQLELRLLRNPKVLDTLNAIRSRFHREAITPPNHRAPVPPRQTPLH